MIFKSLPLLLLCFCVTPTWSSNILALLPAPSPSHLIIEMAVVEALVERNHNVTVITVLPLKNQVEGIRHLYLKSGYVDMQKLMSVVNGRGGIMRLLGMKRMLHLISEGLANILEDAEFKQFMLDPSNQFDLMLYGGINSDYLYGIAAHFDCPIAIIFPNQPMPTMMKAIGNPLEVSYVPFAFIDTDDTTITLKMRFLNLIASGMELWMSSSIQSFMENVYSKHFPATKYESFQQARSRVSLILFSHHFSERPVRPLLPAVVEIGGIQLNEKPNALPQDIAQFLDSASEHGAIFFSMGTNVRGDNLQTGALQKIFNVFSKLPQKVLWKYDHETELPGNSSNILYKKWLPQSDVLGHPNIRLFFTHGGKGGITEAQFNAVPMVGLPIFGDQPQNMDVVQRKGYGLALDHGKPLSEEIIAKAIAEVLHNASYRNAVRKFSSIYRDRSMSAKDTAVFWLEYIIRHKGAPHMQSPMRHMSFIETHNIDILLIILAVFLILAKLLLICLSFVKRKLFGKTKID